MKSERQIIDLIKNDKSSIESLCRICLTDDGTCSLFEIQNNVSYSEKVTLCTSIIIEKGDGLPCRICNECLKHLNVADNFRTKCLYSDSLLRKLVLEENNKGLLTTAECDEFVSTPLYDDIKQELSFDEDTPLEYFNEQFKKCKRKFKTSRNKTEKSGADIVENSHEKSINGEVYTCSECSEEFSKKSKLNSHLKNTHRIKRKSKGKDNGNTEGDNEKDLKSESNLKLESKVYKEVFMGRITGQGKERKYHCVECDYVTQIRKSFIFHTRKHTGERPHVCNICDRAFVLPSSLIYHKKTHNEKNFTCPTCAKQFYCKQHYTRHLSVHTKEKKAVCTICNKALKSKITLQVHMNRHNNIKNYSCETCGATFVTVSELIGHSKIHTGEKKFACNICNFKSYKKTGLERHLKYHSGEKTFRCDRCDKICCTRGELKCHMRKHTKEKNYPCTVCEQKFMHSSSLNTHMLRVHKIKFKWRDMIDRRIVK